MRQVYLLPPSHLSEHTCRWRSRSGQGWHWKGLWSGCQLLLFLAEVEWRSASANLRSVDGWRSGIRITAPPMLNSIRFVPRPKRCLKKVWRASSESTARKTPFPARRAQRPILRRPSSWAFRYFFVSATWRSKFLVSFLSGTRRCDRLDECVIGYILIVVWRSRKPLYPSELGETEIVFKLWQG